MGKVVELSRSRRPANLTIFGSKFDKYSISICFKKERFLQVADGKQLHPSLLLLSCFQKSRTAAVEAHLRVICTCLFRPNGTACNRHNVTERKRFSFHRLEVTVGRFPQNRSYPFRPQVNFRGERFKLATRSVPSKKASTYDPLYFPFSAERNGMQLAECNRTKGKSSFRSTRLEVTAISELSFLTERAFSG
uniref:Ribosomal protein L5 n=1 Tax=Romanomermis culicivorax TaxID=13658 RepID=A0A915INZ6_ROMCU